MGIVHGIDLDNWLKTLAPSYINNLLTAARPGLTESKRAKMDWDDQITSIKEYLWTYGVEALPDAIQKLLPGFNPASGSSYEQLGPGGSNKLRFSQKYTLDCASHEELKEWKSAFQKAFKPRESHRATRCLGKKEWESCKGVYMQEKALKAAGKSSRNSSPSKSR